MSPLNFESHLESGHYSSKPQQCLWQQLYITTDRILTEILAEMCPWTKKFPLNFGSHRESGHLFQAPTIPLAATPHNCRSDSRGNFSRDVSLDNEVPIKFWKLPGEWTPLPSLNNSSGSNSTQLQIGFSWKF